MRHFDVANRDRDRGTFIASITPASESHSPASARRWARTTTSIACSGCATTRITCSASASITSPPRCHLRRVVFLERYDAFSRSRQASPGAAVHRPVAQLGGRHLGQDALVLLNADVLRIAQKFDLRLSYDFSRGRGIYNYVTGPVADRTLPEEAWFRRRCRRRPSCRRRSASSTAAPSISCTRLTAACRWACPTGTISYSVSDFTLDIESNPELVRGQAMLMGYLYRPTPRTCSGRGCVPLLGSQGGSGSLDAGWRKTPSSSKTVVRTCEVLSRGGGSPPLEESPLVPIHRR